MGSFGEAVKIDFCVSPSEILIWLVWGRGHVSAFSTGLQIRLQIRYSSTTVCPRAVVLNLLAPETVLRGTMGGGGWFQDDSSELPLLCSLC